MLVNAGAADGPVVLFPEGGSRTNAKGVMRFEPVFGENDRESDSALALLKRTHIVSFTFPSQSDSPAQPMETRIGFLSRLLINASVRKMELTSLHTSDIPGIQDGEMDKIYSDHSVTKTYVLRSMLAKMMGVKTVDLGVKEYAEFHAYFFGVKHG